MKKILLAISGAIATLFMNTEAQAGPLAPIVYKGNDLRAQAWCLNHRARQLEGQVAAAKQWGVNPRGMSLQARDMRNQARLLAKQSNRVALAAFNSGYIRPGYSIL